MRIFYVVVFDRLTTKKYVDHRKLCFKTELRLFPHFKVSYFK